MTPKLLSLFSSHLLTTYSLSLLSGAAFSRAYSTAVIYLVNSHFCQMKADIATRMKIWVIKSTKESSCKICITAHAVQTCEHARLEANFVNNNNQQGLPGTAQGLEHPALPSWVSFSWRWFRNLLYNEKRWSYWPLGGYLLPAGRWQHCLADPTSQYTLYGSLWWPHKCQGQHVGA